MSTITTIANSIQTLLNSAIKPAQTLPALLIYATSIQRPGLSPSKIAASIIEANNALGIPTGVNDDGTPNIINEYTYNIVRQVIEALQMEGVVQVAIPAGSLTIQSNGANAGGPVVSVGTNLTDTTAYGIIV